MRKLQGQLGLVMNSKISRMGESEVKDNDMSAIVHFCPRLTNLLQLITIVSTRHSYREQTYPNRLYRWTSVFLISITSITS